MQVHWVGIVLLVATHAARIAPAAHHVTTPAEYVDALKSVVHNGSCSAQYTVSADLYGTLTSFDTNSSDHAQYLDGRGVNYTAGGTAVAWFSDHSSLEAFLNSEQGCCGDKIMDIGGCLCKIAQSVGLNTVWIDWPGFPRLDFEYLVTRADFNNKTSFGPVNNTNPINLIQPTWTNLLHTYPGTFSSVFAGAENSTWRTPDCSPTDDVIQTLSATSGQAGWNALLEKFPKDFGRLGCTTTGCDGLVPLSFAAKFSPTELCTNPAVVRAYLATFLDANPLYDGTGVAGAAQAPEFIAVPNRRVGTKATRAFFFHLEDHKPLECKPAHW